MFLLRISRRTKGRDLGRMHMSKKIVFLGTPGVAATCLSILFEESKSNSNFEIVAAVSQPPARANRGMKVTKSPVHELAERLSIPVYCPVKPSEVDFISVMHQLNVDLCVTAAYGNYLPKKFLSIPKFGTLNIHPSLLPKYRGASPVQKCIESGDTQTGVTVLFSESKMDGGPILRQSVPLLLIGDEKAPALTQRLFIEGCQLLISALPSVFKGDAKLSYQDDCQATVAPKLTVAESTIDFATMTAVSIDRKVRAFVGWPGTWTFLSIGDNNAPLRVKIVNAMVLEDKQDPEIICQQGGVVPNSSSNLVIPQKIAPQQYVLRVTCADGSVLGILDLQPQFKKSMSAAAFVNGLRGKTVRWHSPAQLMDSSHNCQ